MNAFTDTTTFKAIQAFKGLQDNYNSDTYLAQSDAAGTYVSNSNLQVTLSGYVQTETGKSLSTNDFTTAEKAKLGGIETGAQVNKIENVSIDGTIQTINSDTKVLVLDLSNFATKADVASVYKYKGSVQNYAALPTDTSLISVGDVYNVEQAGGTDVKGTAIKAGDNVAWTGSGWDVLAGTIDLSAYLTSAQAAATYITNASLQSALSAAVPSGVVLSTVASTVEGAIWIGE